MGYETERREAIEAGRAALESLYAAREDLKKARGWGIADMLGGGLVTDVIKHSKMNKAEKHIEMAKINLEIFGKELQDLKNYVDLDFNKADFLSFADYFFDGLFADWAMQDRINKAREQVDDAIRQVEYALSLFS